MRGEGTARGVYSAVMTPHVRTGRESVTPGRWLATGACASALLCAIAGAAALDLARRTHESARVPRQAVTGRAAEALGDSAIFATPVVPAGVRPAIPHADAESAAVAMGYEDA